MTTYQGRRDFRAGAAAIVASVVPTLLFATGAVMTYRSQGWNWVSVSLACLTVLGLAAIVESLVLRVQLTDDALTVTGLLGRRRYLLTEIQSVAGEAKGTSASMRLATGRVVRLPWVRGGLGNSIRAWLKASKPLT